MRTPRSGIKAARRAFPLDKHRLGPRARLSSMNCTDPEEYQSSDERLAGYLARIRALIETRRHNERSLLLSARDNPWIKILGLLVRIHEAQDEGSNQDAQAQMILQLGFEVAAIEALAQPPSGMESPRLLQ